MHKKILLLINMLLIFAIMFNVINTSAMILTYNGEDHEYTADDIHLIIDGENVKTIVPPIILNDRTLVPVREVFEKMAGTVLWDEQTQTVAVSYGKIEMKLTINNKNVSVNDSVIEISTNDPPPMIINNKTMIPLRFVAEKLGFSVLWDEGTRTVSILSPKAEENKNEVGSADGSKKNKITEISQESDSKYDYIYVAMDKPVSPSVLRLSNSERVVFDFADAEQTMSKNGFGEIEDDGNILTNIRYSKFDANTVRIVLDVVFQPQVSIIKWSEGIIIRLSKSDNTKVLYNAIEKSISLPTGYKLVDYKEDSSVFKLTLNTSELKKETIDIDDEYVDNIAIANKADQTSITVILKDDFSCTYDKNSGKIMIDADAEDEDLDKEIAPSIPHDYNLVVIDAGHGGKDGGAICENEDGSYDIVEKEINLDIARKVYDLLTDSGINAIMTRDTDDYISLAERVEISNNANAALFVSIHCNAMDNQPDINGSMVFYHPGAKYEGTSVTGKLLATNILNGIMANTTFANKDIRDGSTLYVIRNNKIPAVLVETAFITNNGDRKMLNDENVRKKMAQGICDGIINTLNSIKE